VPQIIPASALGRGNQLSPSERITIGMIGMGNRGTSSFQSMEPLPDHQVVAVAECRRQRALRAQEMIQDFYAGRIGKESYHGCQLYTEFRDLLARDDIDAVWACVPDHWHGVLYNRVIESGKDVYGEKPISRWIADGIRIRDAVRRYGCVFQTGTQQRSTPHFRHACELARNGYLGKVHTVAVGAPAGTSYPVEPPCDPPEGFDYDRWSGPAPLIPFDKKRCEWLAMYMISHYCAGFITNWGVHHLDIAGWGCPELFQKSFEITGKGELPATGMTDTWTTWHMQLRWPNGLKMEYSSIGSPCESGTKFIGDQGWVRADRSGIWSEPASLVKVNFGPKDVRLHASPDCGDQYSYTSHTADFFRSVRTRQDPVSPVEEGHAASTLGNVSDICLRLGRKLKWDPAQQQFVGDDDANAMLSRPARSPWTI
jgi:predicted dehydrogenase